MRQVIHQRPLVICAIALGLMTAHVSLLQSIPSASAQQVTGSAYQGSSGTGYQGRRIESLDPSLLYPTKSLEKKDTQSLTYRPHRLIRKPQNAPFASVEPSPSSPSSISSLPMPSPSLQNDNTIPQSKEPSSFTGSARPTVPLATVSVAPTSGTTSGATAAGTASTGTIPLAAAGTGNSSTSGNGNAGGRSMSKLAEEMPGLAQLMSPPSAPTPSTPPPSINPAIGASPTVVSFTATQGGANPAPQTLSISNTGGGTLSWSASPSIAWLSVSSASGTGSGAMTLSVVTGSLTVGTHSGMITLSAPNATTVTVPVTFTLAAPPAIGASQAALSFTATQGGANPAPQTVTISNTGGTLSWNASETASWLTLSPPSGSGAGTLTATVNTASLATGPHTTTITVAASGATSRTINVTLTVNAPASSSATLTWNANTENNLGGYKVYRATSSGTYGAPITTLVGNVTNYVATGLQVGTTYFFVVTAYDTAGNESGVSNEVSKSVF